MSRVIYGVIFLLLFLLLNSGLDSSALADETRDRNYGTSIKTKKVDEYSRLGSKVTLRPPGSVGQIDFCADSDLECKNFNASGSRTEIVCGGGTSHGGWSALSGGAGQCWDNLDVCFYVGTNAETCVKASAAATVKYQAYSKCTSPGPKGSCTFNYTGTGTITEDTGDDMFRINKGAKVFFEYRNLGPLGTRHRLSWVDRHDSVTPIDQGLMLPSGPFSGPDKYEDFRIFMERGLQDVDTEPGCYPVDLSMCADIPAPEPPPVDGACGTAHGQHGSFTSLSAIPSNRFCLIGSSGSKSETATRISWRCSGLNGGSSASCYVNKPIAAACRGFSGNHASQPATSTSNGCSAGTYADASDSSAQWRWTCRGSNGGANASCSANKVPPPPPPEPDPPPPTTACIPTGQPVPAGQTQCPTNECFFWVSGIFGLNEHYMPTTGVGSADKIGSESEQANLVGVGDYPDSYGSAANPGPFFKAANKTFDTIALGTNTRLRVYRGLNFSGPIIADYTGPLVMTNRYAVDEPNYAGGYAYTMNRYLNEDWSGSGPLFQQFPPSTRKLTPEMTTLWGWSDTTESIKSTIANGTWGPSMSTILPVQTSIRVSCD